MTHTHAPPAAHSASSSGSPGSPAGSGPPGGLPSPRDLGRSLTGWARRDARFDVPASLVVFLVAVPLSLGIAVASGAPVAAGLIAAAVGGILAGIVGGAPLQVSGPAAGLTVVVAEVVAEFGWEATCAITAMAGLLQLVLGATRLGRYALAISPTVVAAMLAGIGISIVLGQLNVALGSTSQPSAWANLQSIGSSLLSPDSHALLAATGVVVILLLWPRMPARVKAVPGPLVAVTLLTLMAAAWLPDAERVDLGGALLDQIGTVAMPEGTPLAVAGAVLTVALIASVESLLSAVAIDKLHDGPRARLDRELVGQGVANTASGALGGLPVTGVIVRSATNVAAGARTRASAILHGVWVLVFALLLVGLVEQIPLAALAGLLLVMGTGLVKPADVRRSRARGELWIYVATVVGVLALNLVEGVLIGLVGALLLTLWRTAQVKVDVREAGPAPDGRALWVVEVHGSVSFLALPVLARRLATVPEGQVVEVDLLVDYLDPAARDQIDDWRSRYEAQGGQVVVEHSGPAGEEAAAERAAKSRPVSPRAWLPWGAWQNGGADLGTTAPAHPLAVGVREYHRRTSASLQPVYDELREGQAPRAAFLGCVDSRLVPNQLTSSGPGDLFTIRTMGNLAPADGDDDGAVSAPVLYAVDQLGVEVVVVCGHSGCGAMTAAVASDEAAGPAAGAEGAAGADASDPVDRWLRHAAPSVSAWRAQHPVGASAAAAGDGEVDQLAQVNVAVTLDRLREVLGAERLERVRLVGLFFRIDDGSLSVLRDDAFVDLTDAELDRLAHLAG